MQPVTQKKVDVQPTAVNAVEVALQQKSPREILNDPGLSPAEKEKVLKSMAFHVRSRLDALSEGMTSHPEGQANSDSNLLEEIGHALMSLAPPDPKHRHL